MRGRSKHDRRNHFNPGIFCFGSIHCMDWKKSMSQQSVDNALGGYEEQPPLRMNAYYFSFRPTGVREIDMILSAVASAGKAYHHTDQWGEEPYGSEDGKSYVDLIQDAANNAASHQSATPTVDGDGVERAYREGYKDSKGHYSVNENLENQHWGVSKAKAALTQQPANGWRPISEAPANTLIRIRLGNWVGTGKYCPSEDWDETKNPYCSVLHYNGNVLVPVFYASHFMPLPPTSQGETNHG